MASIIIAAMSRYMSKVAPSLITFVVWAAVATSVIGWGLKIRHATAPSQLAMPVSAVGAEVTPATLARSLGGGGQSAQPANPVSGGDRGRFGLVGVVASGESSGVALIAIDGKPARPYRVGAEVADGWVVEKLGSRSAVLGPREGQGGKLEIAMPPLEARR